MKTKLQKQLYSARYEYNKWLKKLTQEGFEIPSNLKELPSIPKKITPSSVKRIKNLTMKLKEQSTIRITEVDRIGRVTEKDVNRRQLINKARAEARIAKLAEKREQAAAEKEAARSFRDVSEPTPPPIDEDYDIDDYGNEIAQYEQDFIDFVLDKFKEDVNRIAEGLEDRGLSPKHQANVNEAVDYLIGVAEHYQNADRDTGYLFAKALEKAKYNGHYIDEKILYSESSCQEFIMAVESYMDMADLPDDFGNAADALRDAQSNAGYRSMDDEPFEASASEWSHDIDDLFDD